MERKKNETPEEHEFSDSQEVESLQIAVRFQEMYHAIERCVWDLGLAGYQEHTQLKEQFEKTLNAPHQVLLAVALYYLSNRLDSSKREHGPAIRTLGEVVTFAGKLASAYRPEPAEGDDRENDEETGVTVN